MLKKKEPAPKQSGGPQIARATFAATWNGRLMLCLATVAALTLSFAPVKQFYLAWVGLVPWLVMVAHCRSKKSAFFMSWLTGITVFSVCMWWIGYVTAPGAMGLMVYMGLWFAIAAMVMRGAGLLQLAEGQVVPWQRLTLTMFLIALVWVATEFTWGNLFTGLPWLYIGHTQTPILAMCQIADLTGTYGVSFFVALINAWVFLLVMHRFDFRRLMLPGVFVLVILGLILGYGIFRMGQQTTSPGPLVMVVQPNYPQDNSGAKGAGYDEILEFHIQATQNAIKELESKNQKPDLVAWSETMMPEFNSGFRDVLRRSDNQSGSARLDLMYKQVSDLAANNHVNIVTGGHAMLPDRPINGRQQWSRRNCSFLFDKEGREAAERYDKIHLVPFGEYMPFRESFPPLYRLFNIFNPYKDDYTVAPGKDLTFFEMKGAAGQSYRFVTPICFEDVDSGLVAGMFAGPNRTKRADFIVNLTNDGWFATPQMQQHLQLAIFRSIENRVSTARSVNTGVSGFIDSVGRVHDALPIHVTGTATARLELDSRVAPYTHIGDLFGKICVAGALGMIGFGIWRSRRAKTA